MFHGGLRYHRNRRPIALQSTRDSISIVVSMFHAAWRLILIMQVTLRTGPCLEFTTRIEQTAYHQVAELLAWNWIAAHAVVKPSKYHQPFSLIRPDFVNASPKFNLFGSLFWPNPMKPLLWCKSILAAAYIFYRGAAEFIEPQSYCFWELEHAERPSVLRGVHRDAPSLFLRYISSYAISPHTLYLHNLST